MYEDKLIVGTLNVRGLKINFKIHELVTDVEFHNINVLCMQETHNVEEINEKTISVRNRKYHYINLGCQNRFHGLGFIVRSGLVFTYQKLHDRIGLITLEISKNNKKSKLYIYIMCIRPGNVRILSLIKCIAY